MDVQVFLANWEIECCQPPPGIDDKVAWRLRWADEPTGPGVVTLSWQSTVPPRVAGCDARGLYLQYGGVTAWWPDAAPESVPTRGSLLAERHGGPPVEMPATVGTVVGVHVVEQLYRRTAPRSYTPAAGQGALRAVQRSPTWFDRGRMPISPRSEPEPESFRAESGVLVTVRVDGPFHQSR